LRQGLANAAATCGGDTHARCVCTALVLQASTQFEGLGSPITSIDITCDGKWVVATTDSYLLLANRKALAGATCVLTQYCSRVYRQLVPLSLMTTKLLQACPGASTTVHVEEPYLCTHLWLTHKTAVL
jgi:hypothetical protein